MSYEVIKTIRGRRYRYRQETYREGGKVKTKSVYIGPVDGPRRKKRGGGFPAINPLAILLNGVALAAYIAKHGLKSPSYKVRDVESGRTRQMRHAELKALYKQYGLDLSSPQAFRATRALLTQEQEQELMHKLLAGGRAARAPKAPEPKADWSSLEAKLAANKAARQTAQDAPGRTQEAPAKNFTVDDEIEAREAKFEASVDEYNAGTTAAPDAPAPDDAPLPS